MADLPSDPMAREDGSITEHRRGGRLIGWRVRVREEGRRVSYGIYPTLDEAERKLAAVLALRDSTSRETTLAAWGETWLRGRERAGHRAWKKDRARWTKWIGASWIARLPLRRVQRADVVRFLRELHEAKSDRGKPLSRQSIVHVLNLLRRCLHDALDEGRASSNAAADVSVPRLRGASREEPWAWLTAGEIADVLSLPVARGSSKAPNRRAPDGSETDTITPAQRAIFTVAIYAGLRAGELWALTWGDVVLDGDRPELVVRASNAGPTKSGKVRRVPLLAPAREALESWRSIAPGVGAALVWPHRARSGSRRHHEGYDADWGRARALAGIQRRVRFHDLRHTCASHLVQGTWGRAWRLEEVAQLLGHASVTTAERYSHMAPGGLHDVARATAPVIPLRKT